jgi:hypothetical protein
MFDWPRPGFLVDFAILAHIASALKFISPMVSKGDGD